MKTKIKKVNELLKKGEPGNISLDAFHENVIYGSHRDRLASPKMCTMAYEY